MREPTATLTRSTRVTFEFELVAVCAEISHPHSVVQRCGRITDNQVSIGAESCAKGLRRESEEKKKRAFQRNDLYRVRAHQSDSNLCRKHSRFRGNLDSALRLSPSQGERIEVRGSRPIETIRLQQPSPSPSPKPTPLPSLALARPSLPKGERGERRPLPAGIQNFICVIREWSRWDRRHRR